MYRGVVSLNNCFILTNAASNQVSVPYCQCDAHVSLLMYSCGGASPACCRHRVAAFASVVGL